tara:strand:- start:300 stop:1187 length:888 start_codon:yes stop_codon:yes gene_type:complete
MTQYSFGSETITNLSFPATRTALNAAIQALASNSSGDADPSVAGTTVANQWWYETDTNILKIRNEANNGWVDVITLDASMTASASELNQLDAITRGSILYGNASGATARLAKGAAGTVLSSDGTDISWAAAAGGGSMEFIASSGAISSAASVAFTQFDDSKYNNYQFVPVNVKPATDNVQIEIHASADGGSSYDTGSNYKLTTGVFTAFYTGASLGNASGDTGLNGIFHIYNAGSAKFTSSVNLMTWTKSDGSINYGGGTGSAHIVDEVTDAIRFKFASGNIASGTILMYGIKKS